MIGNESGPKRYALGVHFSLPKGILRNPRQKVGCWPEASCLDLQGSLQIAACGYDIQGSENNLSAHPPTSFTHCTGGLPNCSHCLKLLGH